MCGNFSRKLFCISGPQSLFARNVVHAMVTGFFDVRMPCEVSTIFSTVTTFSCTNVCACPAAPAAPVAPC